MIKGLILKRIGFTIGLFLSFFSIVNAVFLIAKTIAENAFNDKTIDYQESLSSNLFLIMIILAFFAVFIFLQSKYFTLVQEQFEKKEKIAVNNLKLIIVSILFIIFSTQLYIFLN